MSEISFDEDLGGLLQENQAPVVEPQSHAEIVRKVQANSKVMPAEKPRSIPEANSGAMPHEHVSRTYCIDGKMMKQEDALPILSQEIDGDSFNFLIQKQKQSIEPAELSVVGKDRRYPDLDELDSVVGKVCPFCGESITQEEASWREIGGLCFYGTTDGQPQVYHWACISLWALLHCKGHPMKAAEKFNLPVDEMTAMKMFYRSIPWNRLGFTREEGQ
jgi:hypothetical protein